MVHTSFVPCESVHCLLPIIDQKHGGELTALSLAAVVSVVIITTTSLATSMWKDGSN